MRVGEAEKFRKSGNTTLARPIQKDAELSGFF
jgi:hypothetical protein